MVALHEESKGSSLECDVCESGDPPVNRCATCSHFLCEFCTQAHRRGRNTSSHNLLSLEEAKKMGSAAVTKPAICKEHDGEVIKLFCETCEEAICRDCTIIKHRDHKYTFVKDAFIKGKENLLEILSKTEAKAAFLKEAVDGVLEMKKNVNSHADLTMEEVVNCFSHLTACLDNRCSQLVSEIGKFKFAKLKSLEIQQENLETALAGVQSSLDFTKTALENGSKVEILNMCKQMSSRLQDLNSANWELEPCISEGLTFKSDHQLMEVSIASFGVVTNVVPRQKVRANMSTVTMENGEEGVMYNTLSGQRIKFTIISKEDDGRKKETGGDVFHVFISFEDSGELIARPKIRNHKNGTYSFSVTSPEAGCYKLSVQLKNCHVQGSPFTWVVEKWNLEVFSSRNSEDQGKINLSEENLTVQYSRAGSFSQYHNEIENFGVSGHPLSSRFEFFEWADHEDVYLGYPHRNYYQNVRCMPSQRSIEASSDRSLYAVGSVGFKSGNHMWKVHINGKISRGCSFGIVNTSRNGDHELLELGELNCVCCPKKKNLPLGCNSGDIIELYLNFDSKKLVIYNPRTKKSDTWDGVHGEVSPVFHLVTKGDKFSLKLPQKHEAEECATSSMNFTSEMW